MIGVAEKLAEHGIQPRHFEEREQKLVCPKCSHLRRNKSDPCLSLKIDEKGAAWRCHHCDWSDGFVLREERWSEPRRRDYKPVGGQPLALPAEALRWFVEERCISEETLKLAKVGWSERHRAVVFPYVLPEVGQVGFKYRVPPKQKMWQDDSGQEKPYWLVDQLDPSKGSDLYIVEGELDALALLEAGIRNVVSVPNGGGVKRMPFVELCEQWTDPFERIVLCLDADEKGQAMQEELSRVYGKDRCWQVLWPKDINDANAFLQAYGAADLEAWVREHRQAYPVEGVFGVSDYRDEVLNLFWNGRKKAHSTGLPSLDQFYTVAPGQLTIVTGIPNHGKSELIDQLIFNLARGEDWRFGLASFENPPAEHIVKLIEKRVQMPFWDGPSIRMTSTNAEKAMEWIEERFFFIRSESDEAPTIDWILERARALVKRQGVRGLVIDPYNEIEHKRPDNMSETEYVSALLSKVRRFAHNHGVHVWFVAHPAKMKTEGGRTPVPTLYDISGSAHFVNKADCGLVVHRGEAEGTTEVWVRKVRFKWVGQQGKALLRYNRATGVYADLDRGEAA
jgi:twinkle protein